MNSDWSAAGLVYNPSARCHFRIFLQANIIFVLGNFFLQSYISCALGVGMVGYIMAAYGGSTTIFAFLFSRLAECTGRYVMFGLAGSVNMAILVLLVYWQPSPDALPIYFAIVIVWGLAEGIWQTQSNGKKTIFE